MVVAASSPSPGTPNMMLEICPLVPFTACMVSRNTAPGIISMPNTNGMASAIESRPPMPGVTPTTRPISHREQHQPHDVGRGQHRDERAEHDLDHGVASDPGRRRIPAVPELVRRPSLGAI